MIELLKEARREAEAYRDAFWDDFLDGKSDPELYTRPLLPWEGEHFTECAICGLAFDMRDLDQVAAHEHNGPSLSSGILGARDANQ